MYNSIIRIIARRRKRKTEKIKKRVQFYKIVLSFDNNIIMYSTLTRITYMKYK